MESEQHGVHVHQRSTSLGPIGRSLQAERILRVLLVAHIRDVSHLGRARSRMSALVGMVQAKDRSSAGSRGHLRHDSRHPRRIERILVRIRIRIFIPKRRVGHAANGSRLLLLIRPEFDGLLRHSISLGEREKRSH